MHYLLDFLILCCLVAMNGFFSMSEMAVVSTKRPRLEKLAKDQKGAAVALDLYDSPTQFLSALQVGITLVGVFLGVYSGESFSQPLQELLNRVDYVSSFSKQLATAIIVSVITYFTIVFGELVPKHLALRYPERIASAIAIPIRTLALILSPLVAVLELSSKTLLYVLGVGTATTAVTEEEVHAVIAEGVTGGIIEPTEQTFLANVMRLGDWPVRAVMVPRNEVDWVDVDSDPQTVIEKLRTTPYSLLLVAEGSLDRPVGIVQAKDLLRLMLDRKPLVLRDALEQPLYVQGEMLAVDALNLLKSAPVHLAIVVDTAHAVEGIVTPADMLKIIVGGIDQPAFGEEPQITTREDGSWLVDGDVHMDVLCDMLGMSNLQEEVEYHTVAGFVLFHLERIPTEGDHFLWHDYRFEVADMDGTRVDKLLVNRVAPDLDEHSG